jgi:hypothetical protein
MLGGALLSWHLKPAAVTTVTRDDPGPTQGVFRKSQPAASLEAGSVTPAAKTIGMRLSYPSEARTAINAAKSV